MFNLRHCTKLMSRAVKYTRFYSSDLYEPTYLDVILFQINWTLNLNKLNFRHLNQKFQFMMQLIFN